MNENKETGDVAFRIQARILSEVRQELRVERATVKILKERLAEEETLANTLQHALDVEREEFGRKNVEKDDRITILKNRVDSVNYDYNQAYGGKPASSFGPDPFERIRFQPPAPDKAPE